jgi:ADP-heptose:LPS heptosyltransferase
LPALPDPNNSKIMSEKAKVRSILIGQLNNNGDCVLATSVARQIKNDFPGCKLTWAIGSNCSDILNLNPYVDEVWPIPLANFKKETVESAWTAFVGEAHTRKREGIYDDIYLTQYSYGHYKNFRGITRASIFAGYPGNVVGEIKPILRLTDQEKVNVRSFFERNGLANFKKIVVFECAAFSGQSFIDERFVQQFAKIFQQKFPDNCLILSAKDININNDNVLSASELSFRENAELINCCDLFLGCSSGISWLTTSEAVKDDLLKILLIDESCPQASMILDHRYFNLDSSRILELKKCTPEELAEIIVDFPANSPIEESFRLRLNYEHVCFVDPFVVFWSQKNFRTAFQIFEKANLKAKLSIIKYLAKSTFLSHR